MILSIPYHSFYLLYAFRGRNGLIECPRRGEASRNYLLFILKDKFHKFSQCAHWFSSSREKQPLRDSFHLLFWHCLHHSQMTSMFCAPAIRLQFLWLVRRWERKGVSGLLGCGFIELCVFISFNFQISSMCLTPKICEELGH